MKLRMALEEKLLDVRLRDRLVSEGKIKADEVDAYLNGLNDEEGNYKFLGEEEKTSTTTEQ